MPLDQPDQSKEMSFLEHLEELRWHLIRAAIAVMVISIAAFIAVDFVFGVVILGPAQPDFWTFKMMCRLSDAVNIDALCIGDMPFRLQSRKMTGQFTMHITSSMVIGIIASFPYVFWEIWRFVSPGMYSKERQSSKGAVFFVSLLFATGVLFGYYIMSPLAVNFLANYQVNEMIMNEFDITSYVGTVTMLVLGSGILFQLPMVIYFLTKVGVVTPDFLRTYRRHALVIILVLGAVLTPPDPFSQILIAIPLVGLYEVSIYVSRITLKRMRKRERELYGDDKPMKQ
ncbi:MAG: twin-arginine translocase subunit TatC [Candidatus Cyclobacteriaceae bacterium M2_1C_046]